MLFTRKLITKFIPDFVNVTDERFVQVVNALGMEIESIKKYEPIDNVVVGQILSYRPVEGTHLSLCQVKINDIQTNTIVCGASHLKEGVKVLVALEGAQLPNGLTISKRMIHGMESNGMICSYGELTNNDAVVADAEKDEIIMLEEGEVGSSNWMPLIGLDDTIYDITVPANRNDENAYLVFCYELAHKLNLRFNFDWRKSVGSLSSSTNQIDVEIGACTFLSFLDYNMSAKMHQRSNWATKSLLMNHGIKPFNRLLDTLSIITLLTNCPTHVYDADKLHGRMSCRMATEDFKFVALNGNTYSLTKNDILIYDQAQPVSLAAIIGSDSTKITSKTIRCRIEVGNFNFAQIRTTAIRINCETDASKKASRPLSNYLNIVALGLIRKHLGQPTKQVVWCHPNWNRNKIKLDYQVLSWFINEPLTKNFVISSLRKLGYWNSFFSPNKFSVPPWRMDVQNQQDLFEDVLKIIDVNKLKPIAISDILLPLADNHEYELKQTIKNVLINNYFNEVKTYNLTHKNSIDKFNVFNLKDPIKIIVNNSNREYFRLSLFDKMLKIYKYNDARKLDLMPIFEMQKIFTNTDKTLNITCLALDKYDIDPITRSTLATNLNYFKSVVNHIAKVLNVNVSYKPAEVKEFYANESLAIIYDNQIIGYMGKIKISVLKPYDLNNKKIYGLTLNIDTLLNNYNHQHFMIEQFGIFQRLSKDVNIILDHANVHLVHKKIQDIKQLPDVATAKIINIFKKDGKTIYTVRYYLVDTKQFTSHDLEIITKQIESLSSM